MTGKIPWNDSLFNFREILFIFDKNRLFPYPVANTQSPETAGAFQKLKLPCLGALPNVFHDDRYCEAHRMTVGVLFPKVERVFSI